jgi:uncharacterized protein (DUF1499 family)
MAQSIAFLGLTTSLLGALLAHLRGTSPTVGFGIFGLGLVIMALAGVGGIVHLLRFGTAQAPWAALVFGAGALAAFATVFVVNRLHPIRDITTDPAQAPSLAGVAPYDPDNWNVQAGRYPEVQPLIVQIPPAEAFLLVKRALEVYFPTWKIRRESPSERRIELESESFLFHFVDDIVVELRHVTGDARSTRIDFRSRSRFGRSDLGGNAAKILRLSQRLAESIRPAVVANPALGTAVSAQ